MSLAVKSITAIIMIGIFVMNLLAVIGMGYLTKFSFHSEKPPCLIDLPDDTRCITLTNTQLGFTKLSVVLFWIGFVVMILGGINSYISTI